MFKETYKLSNGVEIPKLGLGTWLLDDGQAAQAVLSSDVFQRLDKMQINDDELIR